MAIVVSPADGRVHGDSRWTDDALMSPCHVHSEGGQLLTGPETPCFRGVSNEVGSAPAPDCLL